MKAVAFESYPEINGFVEKFVIFFQLEDIFSYSNKMDLKYFLIQWEGRTFPNSTYSCSNVGQKKTERQKKTVLARKLSVLFFEKQNQLIKLIKISFI